MRLAIVDMHDILFKIFPFISMQSQKAHFRLLSLFFAGIMVFATLAFTPVASASPTDGTIDASDRYAWSENTGWIDFGTVNGNVHVTDAGLSGSALSENIGWIVLDGVENDAEGNLSGYAWGENVGWIKFDPANGGVTISDSGVFSGSALGENIGWIVFDTDNPVTTDWRPASTRGGGGGDDDDDDDGGGDDSGDDDDEGTPTVSSGGGGGLPPAAYEPVVAPVGNFGVSINGNAASTTARNVTLTLRGGSNTRSVRLSQSSTFPEGFQVSYPAGANQTTVSFTLSEGEGVKTVYTQFCTEWGNCSGTFSDEILFVVVKPPTIIDQITDLPGIIVEDIKDVGEVLQPLLPPVIRPVSPTTPSADTGTETGTGEQPVFEPGEEPVVPEEAPPSFQAIWDLSPADAVATFAQGSLPAELIRFSEKFPILEQTLQRLGVNTVGDVSKLRGVRLTLEGLAERLGLSKPQPISQLSAADKERMPTGVIFARVGGELIDLKTTFTVTPDGEIQQSVNTVVGKTLQLAIKPDTDAASVKGYLAFLTSGVQGPVSDAPHTFLSRLFGAQPVHAQAVPTAATTVEERLLLLSFNYTDPDKDGIYTADVEVPVVAGEYEIITVIEFNDPALGRKALRLITVVDPEGYVYERTKGKETRIPGAVVSLYWLNPQTNEYMLWPAEDYQQRNPQTTDNRGTYSFLVPPGYYYLKTEAPGYPVYESEPFEVAEGVGVHTNIELSSDLWRDFIDWKVILLLLVTALLVINFYRDRRRRDT